MQRRTVQDPQGASSAISRRAVRGTVAKLGLALATSGAALLALGPRGDAAPSPAGCEPGSGPVTVIEVDGLVDPVLADFVDTQIGDAEDICAVALVLQLDSGDAIVDDAQLDDLVERIERADVPVAVWIGPSGSRAAGGAVRLVAASDPTGISVGSSIEVTPELLEATGVEPTDLGDAEVGDRIGAARAVRLGLVDNDASTIGDFIIGLDGVETRPAREGTGREPVTPVQFVSLPITAQLMHTVASPPTAYLLFVIGLSLLLFELFTAGVGVAGVVGAGALILGCYGLVALPTRPLGVALLLFAMFAYGVDIQTGVPRVWTGIATVSFVLGSLLLYDGVSVSWITLLFAFVGITLAMVGGMPTMVRSRFSTPTIGREWMIGEMGTARTDIAPDGVVTLRDAPWRARTNRATPIRKDDPVRVVSIEGLVLEVEPEEGGAKDYRERARSSD
jgi:membrane-bound serine protease (ClpP class)